jgi:hypothetical protein
MSVSAVATQIMQEQAARLGKEVPTRVFPKSFQNKLVGALEAIKFEALPKDDDTIWEDYRAPQTLLVLQRTIEPVKGHKVLQKVTFYEKNGLTVSTNGDLNKLITEAGL